MMYLNFDANPIANGSATIEPIHMMYLNTDNAIVRFDGVD